MEHARFVGTNEWEAVPHHADSEGQCQSDAGVVEGCQAGGKLSGEAEDDGRKTDPADRHCANGVGPLAQVERAGDKTVAACSQWQAARSVRGIRLRWLVSSSSLSRRR